MSMRPAKNPRICVICGREVATTRDHIPPKGIFCKPRPNNLISVPACSRCNNSVSGLDERFKVNLELHVGASSGGSGEFFYRAALRTLKNNRRLLNEMLSKLEPVYLTTESGIIHSRGHRILWDSEAHDLIVERTIRGLYYHHFNEILGDRVDIKVHWFRKLTPEMVEMSNDWSAYIFGKGEVMYRYGRANEFPLNSTWIFQFYEAHWAGGYTEPKNELPHNASSDKKVG